MRPRADGRHISPGTGSVNAFATITATWDEGASLDHIEHAIQQAAAKATARARIVHRIESKPQPPYERVDLPYNARPLLPAVLPRPTP